MGPCRKCGQFECECKATSPAPLPRERVEQLRDSAKYTATLGFGYDCRYDPAFMVGVFSELLALRDENEKLKRRNAEAERIIESFRANPYGCSFCDSGKLRTPDNPAKDHDDDCVFVVAHDFLACPLEPR